MKKHLLVVGIIFLFILSSVSPLTFGSNINSKEQSTTENYDRYLFPEFYNSYNVDEPGYNLMRKFDNNYKPQKMDDPSGTSTICGYVTDEETGLPVENAKVDIERNGKYWNSIYTNSTGFYSKITPPTYTIRLHANKEEYLSKYYCCYVLYENDTLWINMSLCSHPLENSIVYGYVTDNVTNNPVEDAEIKLSWWNDDGHYENYTYTDYLGFYSMKVAAGEIRMSTYPEEYFYESWPSGSYNLGENETVWANISVYPRPNENLVIYGYIYDNETGDPLENAKVEFFWNVGHHNSYSNITSTDSQGYYSINAAAGKVRVEAYANGYWDKSSPVWILGENETAWVNLSLELLPPENSVVCGYITDVNTSEPVELAKVDLNWEEYTLPRRWNRTYTGTSGFYMMNLPAGEFYLIVRAYGYYSEETAHYNISENETIWLNISMYPPPPRNSVVCGYISDKETGEPIEDVYVNYDYRDPYGHGWWTFVTTNASGFYQIKIPMGEICLRTYHNHYFDENIDWFTIGENETLWINITLRFFNFEPSPPYIDGPTRGKPGEEYNFTFSTYDQHYDDVYYYIEWGDGTSTDWIGPYYCFEGVVLNHSWSKMRTYFIRAKAKDVYGYESYWSTFEVNMPRNKMVTSSLLLRFLERFPLFNLLLQRL